MCQADEIDNAVMAHQKALRDIWRLIGQVRNSKSLEADVRDERLKRLYSTLSTKDIRESFVGDGSRYDIGVSFRSSMANMMRTKKRLRGAGYFIAGGANSKELDRKFGERLGVPTPSELAVNVKTQDVVIQPCTIVKPMKGAGSRGVFYVQEDGALRSVKTRRLYGSLQQAQGEYETLIKPGKSMEWMIEEAIVGPDGDLARDMKAYMFYGEAVVFREILRKGGGTQGNRFANYDGAGSSIGFRPRDIELEGRGVPEAVRLYAEKISLSVPTAFLRVDMLVGADECYLGEITPHPGGTYAGDLYDDLDRVMGVKFHEAESRLFIDMFEGKSFKDYVDVYRAIR